MKKSRFFISLAASLLVVAACQKNELVSSQGEEVVVDFFAQSIETKTVFGEPDGTTYPTLWTSNDTQVKVVVNSQNNATEANLNVSEDGKTATFSASLPKSVEAPFSFKVVSPASALIGYSTTKGVNVAIPTTQEPLTASVDEKAQILYAVSGSYETWPSQPVQLKFSHLTAYGKMSITNLNESEITSISLKSDLNWAGRWNYNGSEFIENSATDLITIKTDHLSDVWFACAPVNMAGKNLEISVETANGVYNKSINFTRGGNFESGKIAKFSVSFEGVTPTTEQVVYTLVKSVDELTVGSEVIIAAANYDKAISTTQNNNNRAQAEITKSDEKLHVTNPSPAVQIFTLAAGSVENTFAFSTGSGYIYAAGNDKNYLRTEDSVDDNASFAITISASGEATMVAQGSNARNVLSYNATNTPPIFSCYAATNTSNKPVALYIKDSGDTPTTPSIDVQATLELTAEEQDGEIAVTFKNFPDLDFADVNVYSDKSCTTAGCDWLDVELNDDNTSIYYYALANTTGSARTAYIKVECLDESFEIVEKVVTVTQQFAVASHTVTYSVNGSTTTSSFAEGASVTFPSNPAAINGYTFVGWTTSSIASPTNTAPSMIDKSSVTMGQNDLTFYAVFAKVSGGNSGYKLVTTVSENNTYVFATSDKAGSAYALDGSVLTSTASNTVAGSAKAVTITESGSDKIISTVDVDLEFKYTGGNSFEVVSSTSGEKLLINGSGIGKSATNYKAFWDSSKGLYGTTGSNAQRFVQLGQDGMMKANTGTGRVYAYEKQSGGSSSTTGYCTIVPEPEPQVVHVTSVTLNRSTASISVNGTVTLTATVNPSNATNKNVTWTSNNTAVATVTDGVVTGKSAGTATITVKTADGNYTATCSVTVTSSSTSGSVTFDYTSNATSTSVTISGVTVSCAQGSGSTPTYNSNSTELRLYSGNTLTVSVPSGKVITQIDFTYSSADNDGNGKFTSNPTGYNSANNWWKNGPANANSVTFTNGDTKQMKIKKIVVYLQ